jgi:D-arabinose 5-phosphate isomerase GutQ
VGREAGKSLPDMQKFLDMINHDNAHFVNQDPEEVAKIVSEEIKDIASTVVVMGAGKSHLIAKSL